MRLLPLGEMFDCEGFDCCVERDTTKVDGDQQRDL